MITLLGLNDLIKYYCYFRWKWHLVKVLSDNLRVLSDVNKAMLCKPHRYWLAEHRKNDSIF
jgi:hypothetical protein